MARSGKTDPAKTPPAPAPSAPASPSAASAKGRKRPDPAAQPPGEVGGPAGPEPTRYGDWQYKGRVTDF